MRLMEKLGMKREGAAQPGEKSGGGWAGLYLYGILREEKEGEKRKERKREVRRTLERHRINTSASVQRGRAYHHEKIQKNPCISWTNSVY